MRSATNRDFVKVVSGGMARNSPHASMVVHSVLTWTVVNCWTTADDRVLAMSDWREKLIVHVLHEARVAQSQTENPMEYTSP